MLSYEEMIKHLSNGNFESLYQHTNQTSTNIIKAKIQEIPSSFFQPTIAIDEEGKQKISLLQFSMETLKMNQERINGLMERYQINPYDMKKLQIIVESIRVANEFGSVYGMEQEDEMGEETEEREEEKPYGISLSSYESIDKAYPLWVAYLCSEATNPLYAVRQKLLEDGMSDKYSAENIVGLIQHTNNLMQGKSEEEKKDFFMHSISGILDESFGKDKEQEEVEI